MTGARDGDTIQDASSPGATPEEVAVRVEAVSREADQAADAAARHSGVSVREIAELAELEAVAALYDTIWRPQGGPLLSAELMRAFGKAGNYVAGAFDGAVLVGACVGFFSAPAHSSLHSHIAGVSDATRRRHVGFAIKLHQRAWTLRRGVRTVAWTFDPLVARNAWFNLVKLGADPAEYLSDFYGGMNDAINGPDGSDRLLVHWDLVAPSVARACAGANQPGDVGGERRRGAVVGLGISASGAPLPGSLDAPTVLIAVPPDIEAVRAADPDLAAQWRAAVRESLGGLLAAGARIDGFDRSGWYVIRQTPSRPMAAGRKEPRR